MKLSTNGHLATQTSRLRGEETEYFQHGVSAYQDQIGVRPVWVELQTSAISLLVITRKLACNYY